MAKPLSHATPGHASSGEVRRSKVQADDSVTVPAAEEYVYITPKGCCYHKKNCPALKRSKHVIRVSKKEAIRRGKRACKICKP